MRHRDNLSEAMEVFLKQLPDPNLTNTPVIISEMKVNGKRVKFKVQKAKSLSGITWRIDSVTEIN